MFPLETREIKDYECHGFRTDQSPWTHGEYNWHIYKYK